MQPEYENKYNALVEECLLEVAEEMCMDDSTHPNSAPFITNKMINSDLETGLRELENEEFSEAPSNNFESIAKNVVPTELNTIIQAYREVGKRNNETVAEGMAHTQQDKIQDGNHHVLCLQCQTICETQEMFENHKIFCVKEENAPKRTTTSSTAKDRKRKNEAVELKLGKESCRTGSKELESKQFIDKLEIYESVQSVYCTICSQLFETRQDLENHIKCLHENTAVISSKRCGHCKEIYRNKRELLNHIAQSHEGRLLFTCFTCDKTYEKWSSLDIHEATHRADKPYLCDLCGKSFKHSNNLRGHKRTHLDESLKKRHVCDVCGNAFRSRYGITGGSRFIAPKKLFREILQRIILPYISHLVSCSRRFHLGEHKNQHDGNRPYSCEQCGKTFCKRIQLRQHRLSHGSNRYVCPICSATFNRRGNMNTHVKRHSNGNGAYTCSVSTSCKDLLQIAQLFVFRH